MHVCMYIYIYIHIHYTVLMLHVFESTHIGLHVCVDLCRSGVYILLRTLTHACMHVFIHAYITHA